MTHDVDAANTIAGKPARSTSVKIPSTSKEKTAEAEQIVRDQEQKKNPMYMANRMVRCAECYEEAKPEEKPETRAGACLKSVPSYMPIFVWLPQLFRGSGWKEILTTDVIAGITVGVVAIPQSMSYANIAGLEYHYGLYSAFLTPVIYVLFGQSRQLAVGPVAIVSLLVEAGINGLLTETECPDFFNNNPSGLGQNEVCPDQYAKLVFLCSLLVAFIQLACRLLRLGFLVSFLAHPVISGFTTGAAFIIMLSQTKYIVGFNIPKSEYVYKTVGHIVTNIQDTKALNCTLGLLCLFTLIAAKSASKKWKKLWWLKSTSPLFISVAGILLLANFQSLKEDHYVKNVGFIPKGLPQTSFDWDFSAVGRVMPTAITVALIGYMESIAISKALASAHKYDINAGQELLALGLTNLIGSAFSCYPVSGSFCRSSVNNGMGAKSGFSSIINSSILLCTILFLAPVFYHLPKFVLGAIVMNAVTGLIETGTKEARNLYKIRKWDFALWLAAFVGTLFLGVLLGIAIAVLLSLFIVINETVRPQITVLWRLPGTSIYRSVKQESGGVFVSGVFMVRIGSSMYFANSSYIKDTLFEYVNSLSRVEPIRYVIIEMTSVTSVDSTAAHAMDEFIRDFKTRSIQVCFAMVGSAVERTLRSAHVMATLGEEWFFPTVHVAVQACLKHQHAENVAKELGLAEKPKESNDCNLAKSAVDEEAAEEVQIVVGDEVNVCNDMHNKYTTVYVNACQSSLAMLNDVTAIFVRHELTVVRAEVDVNPAGAAHMCFWVVETASLQANAPAKLSEKRMENLRDDVKSWLHVALTSPREIIVKEGAVEAGSDEEKNANILDV